MSTSHSNNTVLVRVHVPQRACEPHAPYSTRMSPESTHKFMGFYMETSILDVTL